MFFKKKHFFTVELGQINGPQSIFLKYKLRNTVPAELWFNLLQKAKSFGFSETDRFYNFPKNTQTTLEDLIEKLKDNIDQYNKINSEKKFLIPT